MNIGDVMDGNLVVNLHPLMAMRPSGEIVQVYTRVVTADSIIIYRVIEYREVGDYVDDNDPVNHDQPLWTKVIS